MNWLGWALLSAAFAGLTAVLAKAGVQDVNSNLATAIRTTVIFPLAWAVAFAARAPSVSTVPRNAWLFLTLSGLATGASWLCYFKAISIGEVSKVAPVDKLSVVIAMALAVIFLREEPTWSHWLGGGLIVAGTVVIARA